MKKIKWKTLIITCIVTLIPMLIGIIFNNQLPENIPVHFNINNQPDNYASKEFALFGIPIALTILQIVVSIIIDLRKKEDEDETNFKTSIKWWIPVLSILIGVLLVEYPLRVRLDIRMYICIALCVIAIVVGNYFTDMDSELVKDKILLQPKNEKNSKLFLNIIGYTFMLFGLIIILSIRFHPVVSVVVTIGLAVVIALEIVYFKIKK